MGDYRKAIASLAESYLHMRSETAHDAVVQLYNSMPILPQHYRLTTSDAWCAAFISVLGYQLGLSGKVFPECSVPRMMELYQRAGLWVEDDDYLPKQGDLIVYDWDDDGLGDGIGDPDHIGIVTSRLGCSLLITEGNLGNEVRLRTVYVNDRYIRGYCTPEYEYIDNLIEVPSWAQTEFNAAIDAGITDGSRPLAPCTRYEAAIMALRARGGADDDGR